MSKLIGLRWFRLISLMIFMSFVCASLGCIQMGAGVTPSTIPITSKDSVTELGTTEGSDWALGLFQLQIWPTSTYEAIQEAKRKVGADALIDVRADNKVYWIIVPIYPIITLHKVYVKGKGVKVVRQGAEIY